MFFKRRKEKKESAIIEIGEKEVEVLLGFAQALVNPRIMQILQLLLQRPMSIDELSRELSAPRDEIESIIKRLVNLGVLDSEWYESLERPGEGVLKYVIRRRRGIIKFDLAYLPKALDIETLERKSEELVRIVTTKGKIPKNIAMDELGIRDEEQFEQIVRYTEKFKFPNIREMLSAEIKKAPVKKKGWEIEKLIGEREKVIVKTEIDSLIKLIEESPNEEMEISEAATALHVSEEQVEAWARALDSQGILKLYYPKNPFKKPKIMTMRRYKALYGESA